MIKKTLIKIEIVSEPRQEIEEDITPLRSTQGATKNIHTGAANAIDRDLSTFASVQIDESTLTAWLKIELGEITFIHKIVIYYKFYKNFFNPSDQCAESEEAFKECVDKANNVDVSVYTGEVKQKSCGTLQLTYGLKQTDQIYTLVCNIRGDTVKLSKSTGKIRVMEVVILGKRMWTFVRKFRKFDRSTKLSGKGLKFQPIRSEKALFPGF